VTFRPTLIALVLVLAPALAAAQALDGRLKKIKDTQDHHHRASHRRDAVLVRRRRQAACRLYGRTSASASVASLEQSLGVQGIQVKWVPVTSQSRFDARAKGESTWSAARARSRSGA
jgi:hypothetical protein